MTTATPPPVTREELHHRRIDMRGYRRSDGLFEVEGRVTDRKTSDLTFSFWEKVVPANEAIHDMGVRLAFDQDMTVHEVETFTNASPYRICPEGGRALQSLKGLRMAGGWTRAVRERLGGEKSCTHLMELLIPMATTAFQTLGPLRADEPEKLDAQGRPLKINSCYAYGETNEVVLKRWPQFHKPKGD